MGTFHHGKHELHGITVVVDTDGPDLFVGRCDDILDDRVVLRDVDVHRDGAHELSRAAYLERAAQWGVFKTHERLVLDRARVTSIRRLGEL
ncbi:MAG: hypothetical protein AAGN46_11445 [Acidobacteriota bacterium]